MFNCLELYDIILTSPASARTGNVAKDVAKNTVIVANRILKVCKLRNWNRKRSSEEPGGETETRYAGRPNSPLHWYIRD